MVKRILITNVHGDMNKGDRALFDSLIKILSNYKDINIHVITRHFSKLVVDYPEIEFHKQITKVEYKNSLDKYTKYFLVHLKSVLYLSYPRIFKRFIDTDLKDTLDQFKQSDIVISSPGGFLEDSNPSYILQLFQIYFPLWFDKQVIIAPQSIGPIKSKFGQFLVGWVLKKVNTIFVREPISMNFVTNILKVPNSKVLLVNDLAFKMQKSEICDLSKNDIIYSTVVDWNFPNMPNKKQLQENYMNSMVDFYRFIHSTYGKRIVIINQVSTDLNLAYQLQRIIPEIVTVDDENYSPGQIIEMIKGTEYFIGTRFHSCIFALLANVPIIAISYLPKTDGMLGNLNLDVFSISINSITSELLKEKLNYILGNYMQVKKVLYEKLNDIQSDNRFENHLRDLIY